MNDATQTDAEAAARRLWMGWAEFQQHTICACCKGHRYCGRRSRRGRFLCLPCFDTSPECDRWLTSLARR